MTSIPPFEDRPPALNVPGPYDARHFVTYLRLLEAAKEGAEWREVVKVTFGLDFEVESERARPVYESHLGRARWLREAGYRQLLDHRMQ